jgi:hypothetical protein
MTAPQPNLPADADIHAEDKNRPPRSDLKDAAGWMLLGGAVLIASLRMDRLESQNINPYTVPGLLTGLLGLAMLLLGGLLGLRSWRRGALSQPLEPPTALQREECRRIWVVVALCLFYAVGLVGHGLPFWLASAIYVTGAILLLQRLSADPGQRQLTPRAWRKALIIGVLAAVVTQLVFQELFLVRLP